MFVSAEYLIIDRRTYAPGEIISCALSSEKVKELKRRGLLIDTDEQVLSGEEKIAAETAEPDFAEKEEADEVSDEDTSSAFLIDASAAIVPAKKARRKTT